MQLKSQLARCQIEEHNIYQTKFNKKIKRTISSCEINTTFHDMINNKQLYFRRHTNYHIMYHVKSRSSFTTSKKKEPIVNIDMLSNLKNYQDLFYDIVCNLPGKYNNNNSTSYIDPKVKFYGPLRQPEKNYGVGCKYVPQRLDRTLRLIRSSYLQSVTRIIKPYLYNKIISIINIIIVQSTEFNHSLFLLQWRPSDHQLICRLR